MEYPDALNNNGPMGMLYKKEAAAYLGISLKTLDRYITAGHLKPWKNQINGRVYFDKTDVLKLLGGRPAHKREVVLYCRAATLPGQGAAGVSAETRLSDQIERCTRYCMAAGIRIDRTISEIAKGDSLKDRRGWTELMDLVMRRQVATIVVETPDRICRWGVRELFADVLTWHGVDLHTIQPALQLQEYRDELTEDLANIVYQARQLMGT
jgi:predicted site-specific integrase-resolvase